MKRFVKLVSVMVISLCLAVGCAGNSIFNIKRQDHESPFL